MSISVGLWDANVIKYIFSSFQGNHQSELIEHRISSIKVITFV